MFYSVLTRFEGVCIEWKQKQKVVFFKLTYHFFGRRPLLVHYVFSRMKTYWVPECQAIKPRVQGNAGLIGEGQEKYVLQGGVGAQQTDRLTE